MVRKKKSLEEVIKILETVVKGLVDYEDKIEIKIIKKDPFIVEILCDDQDRGSIIGRQGTTIITLREIFTKISLRHLGEKPTIIVRD